MIFTIQFDSLKDPRCRGPIAKSCIDKNTRDSSNNLIELWNDVFVDSAANGSEVAVIFMNFKSLEGQSEFISRQLSALSSFLSSIFFFMGEKSLFYEHFGAEVRKTNKNCQNFNFIFNFRAKSSILTFKLRSRTRAKKSTSLS